MCVPQIVLNYTNSLNLAETVYNTIRTLVFGSCGYIVLHTMRFFGNANKTNYNDNTSGCITLLKLMDKYQKLPQKQKDKIAFVFFDNEEKFLLGSFSFKHQHKKIYKDKTFVNLAIPSIIPTDNVFHALRQHKMNKQTLLIKRQLVSIHQHKHHLTQIQNKEQGHVPCSLLS